MGARYLWCHVRGGGGGGSGSGRRFAGLGLGLLGRALLGRAAGVARVRHMPCAPERHRLPAELATCSVECWNNGSGDRQKYGSLKFMLITPSLTCELGLRTFGDAADAAYLASYVLARHELPTLFPDLAPAFPDPALRNAPLAPTPMAAAAARAHDRLMHIHPGAAADLPSETDPRPSVQETLFRARYRRPVCTTPRRPTQ